MLFDCRTFLEDHNIYYVSEQSGGRHAVPGWLNLSCPFCSGNPGNHLGFDLNKGFFNCWRCGSKHPYKVVAALANIHSSAVPALLAQYGARPTAFERTIKHKSVTCKLPEECTKLKKIHKQYLAKRNFDWEYLVEMYDLQATGFYGRYAYRIIAPIILEGKLVSYQGRDYTDKQTAKYKACPSDLEVVDHQHILYGLDLVPGDTIIVVEGITDVWRLGPGAVACFGIDYTQEQVQVISQFSNRFILFDEEITAGKQARKLASDLSVFSGHTEVVGLGTDKDPGELTDNEAKMVMDSLL